MAFRTTIITGKTNHIDKDILALVKDLYDGDSGIVGTTGFLTTQSSPTGMSVTVGAGVIYSYISSAGTYYRHELTDSATVLNIDNNSSGSTRIDLVCVKTDLTATPDANGGGIPSLVIVKGTAGAGVPAVPANHDKLYEVSVANGAATISNANLTDTRSPLQIRSEYLGSGTPDSTKYLRGDRTWVTISLAEEGWLTAGETWTYASTITFTVSGDKTAKYTKGTKIKITQTTTKYFYVVSSSHSSGTTTVTVTGGSDYSLANAAITNPSYSYQEHPQGFPHWFNFTPTYGGFSANPTNTCKFSISGGMCVINMFPDSNGTSNATSMTVTTPVSSAAEIFGICAVFDNGGWQASPGRVRLTVGGSTITITKTIADGGFTTSGGKNASLEGFTFPI